MVEKKQSIELQISQRGRWNPAADLRKENISSMFIITSEPAVLIQIESEEGQQWA